MKFQSDKNSSKRKCKAFLVLPTIVNDSLVENEDDFENMPKKTGLKLFTKTWTQKKESKNEEPARPLTATLEKPTILDVTLISKLDMSLVRKEFLNISNICRMPLILKNHRKFKSNKVNRPLSLPPPEKQRKFKKKKLDTSEDSLEDDESSSIQSGRKSKINRLIIKPTRLETSAQIKKNNININNKLLSVTSDTNNNNKTFKLPRKNAGKILNVPNKSDTIKSTKLTEKLPEPCKTCGRPDQPERFHSHPATPLKPSKKMETETQKIPVKNTVQKPMAMKYKSKNSPTKRVVSPVRKPSLPYQKLVHTPPNLPDQTPSSTPAKTSMPRGTSGKRTVTCYICGREFGTASLPLHEPKCLQKWERENQNLPANLRRKQPVKPDSSLSQEEWNAKAWEASQSSLTPCRNCGRTFYPDRLIVHQRSCKVQPGKPNSLAPITPMTNSINLPPSVECYLCGRMFGTNSIKIHEKQCMKKRSVGKDELAKETQLLKTGDQESTSESRTSSARKPPLFLCYLCGKLFTVNSIYIHEPQCLKMWKIENDKLPPHKRRQQPIKPDIQFTHEGKIDIEATNEANWQTHLSQLIPCKLCSRTFNPDRVEIHERSCKGQ